MNHSKTNAFSHARSRRLVAMVYCVGFCFLSINSLASTKTEAGTADSTWNDQLTATDRDTPVFSLLGLDGVEWNNGSLKGKPWIINFWAGWCPPCVEELPALNTTWSQVQNSGVGMLAINIGEDAEKITAFLKKVPIDFPVVLGDPRKTLANWSSRGLPTTLILDSNGRVVYEAIGPRDWDAPSIVETVLELTMH